METILLGTTHRRQEPRSTTKRNDTRGHRNNARKMEAAIDILNIGKSVGIDDITPEMVKYSVRSGAMFLYQIFNKALKETKVPRKWQIGIIVSIYKKDDSRNCSNYQGITLLSVLEKLYSRILDTKIRKQVEITLNEAQCEFRKQRIAAGLNIYH